MITLEQVQKLDAKIKQAVSFISTLREENAQLRSTLSDYENKITDLESMVISLEEGQTKIELGLMDAISKLDDLDIVDKKEKESFEELSPSEESAIVNNINIDENDHSEQAENTTEDSLSSTEEVEHKELISEEKNSDEVVTEETTDDVVTEETTEETTDDVVTEETTDDVVTEETTDDEVVTEEATDDDVVTEEDTTNEVVEEEPVKKKSSDYSIPMLEIF